MSHGFQKLCKRLPWRVSIFVSKNGHLIRRSIPTIWSTASLCVFFTEQSRAWDRTVGDFVSIPGQPCRKNQPSHFDTERTSTHQLKIKLLSWIPDLFGAIQRQHGKGSASSLNDANGVLRKTLQPARWPLLSKCDSRFHPAVCSLRIQSCCEKRHLIVGFV